MGYSVSGVHWDHREQREVRETKTNLGELNIENQTYGVREEIGGNQRFR